MLPLNMTRTRGVSVDGLIAVLKYELKDELLDTVGRCEIDEQGLLMIEIH